MNRTKLNDYLKLSKETSDYNGVVNLPGEYEGLTYIINTNIFVIAAPTQIKIAPVVNGNQCEVSDTLSNIEDCSLFVE